MTSAVEKAGASTILVDARKRYPASGIAYAEDLVLTADHVVTREDDLQVVLPDGKTVQSTLQTSEGKVELKELRQAVAPAEVITIRNADEQKAYERLLSPGWGQLWAGTATIGLAGTQGNAQTRTFTMAMNTARVTNTDKTSLYFSAVKASALINGVSAGTAQAIRGGWGYNRSVSSRLFVNTFNDYEYDRFQDLDLRFVLGGGLGYSAWKGEHGRLDHAGEYKSNREHRFCDAGRGAAGE